MDDDEFAAAATAAAPEPAPAAAAPAAAPVAAPPARAATPVAAPPARSHSPAPPARPHSPSPSATSQKEKSKDKKDKKKSKFGFVKDKGLGIMHLNLKGKGKAKKDEDEEEESEDDEVDGDSKDGKKGKKGKKKKKKKEPEPGYTADVQEAHERINPETLSKKDELFQVRFIVHKARKLSGAITAPLVRIHLANKVLRTKAKRGKNPKWNETVLFSITKSEVDLVNTPVEIKVIDSAKTPQYSLIGLYKCDLAVAWVKKGKNLFYKWIALQNPDEPQDGLTGYINVSIQIIPPGDEAKTLPKLRDEEIDRSDNVFFPPGIVLQPGQFIMKLLNGEDIPQMDTAMFEGVKALIKGTDENAPQKELVDPYVVVEFAGKSLEGKFIEGSFDPIWNELMILQGDFPSIAENLILKVYDNDDFAVDDLVATKLLKMGEISQSSVESGTGFLPMFGPAYIPFYGSHREYSDVYDKFSELNHGVEEGIAYRGRILVELSTSMGLPPEEQEPITDLEQEEVDRIMMNLNRHKYHLFASFFQGNMISEKENQVEFEVSVGDYGNKFSPQSDPAPSTTQPCNPVYDGTQYHFMPWSRTKPTVILHSEWEDADYRVGALNILIWMRDFMTEKVEQYHTLEKAYAKDYEMEDKFDANLQELLAVLKGTEIEEPPENCTELDKKLYEQRMFSINNMIDEITAMMEDGKLYFAPRPDKVKRLQGVLEKLEDLCVEPQLGIPDVFIWMITGTKRVAYHRIPINELMYSRSKFKRGKHCGTTGSFFLKVPRTDEIAAHLTLSLWFGKFEDVSETFKPPRGSEVVVFAETYENQMSVLGSWTTKLLPRPIFSDTTGKYSLPLEAFEAPEGWNFVEDWFISIDRSLTYDNESGLREVKDVVYEGETRIPGTSWGGNFSSTWWQDVKGGEANSKDQVECVEGWQWIADWEVDTNRAVDASGWEFAMDTNVGSYSPIERSYHLSRRKKWVRTRERVSDMTLIKKRDIDPDGWEYSKIFTTKFHPKERKFDMVRRRRYNRKLVSSIPRPVSFKITEVAEAGKPARIFHTSPRIITEYDEKQVHKYQLRAYLYQARGVLGADPSGYSDPYARVVFGNRSAVTHTMKETCSPVWNTTLILDAVELCGYPEDIASNPPFIVVDVFDEDVLSHDKLGRVVCTPTMFTNGRYSCTKLKWYEIGGVKKSKGDILASFELFKLGDGGIELPLMPPFESMKYIVPPAISPEKQLMRVEVLTWGVRLMKDYKMLPVESPHIDIEVGGERISVEKITSCKHHPNFNNPYEFFDVWLPVEEEYLPPINIRVMDNRAFGYTPLIAVATIKEYAPYRCTYNASEAEALSKDANLLKELMGETVLDVEGKEPSIAPAEEGDKGGILDLYHDGGSISLNIEVDVGSNLSVPVEVPASEQGAGDGALIFSNLSIAPSDRTTVPSIASSTDTLIAPSVTPSVDPSVDSSGKTPSWYTTPSIFIAPSRTQSPSPSVQTDSAPLPSQTGTPSATIGAPSLKTAPSVQTGRSAKGDPSIKTSLKTAPSVQTGRSGKVDPSMKADPSVMMNPSVQFSEMAPSEASSDPDILSEIMLRDPSYVPDITITIPQGDASQTGEKPDPKIQKKFDKDVKRQEKTAKRDARLRKKQQKIDKQDQEKAMKETEKDRQKKAKEQSKAQYKAEKDAKKKALKKAEETEESEGFIPESPEKPITLDPLTANGSPEGGSGSGKLGAWYGGGSDKASSKKAETKSSVSKLSRKETRKLKQEEETKPHPDDVLVSDWWSKYYHALGKDERLTRVFKERNLPTITMYEYELEKEHNMFRDLMDVIKLQRPDNELSSDFEEDSEDDDAHVGLFKGSFKIYPISDEMHKKAEKGDYPALMFKNLPSNDEERVLVRLYVIAGVNLTPLDFGGSVDPYLWVKCGKEVKNDQSNHLTKQINPEFGKMFEFDVHLPRESQMKIFVYDHDLIGADDVVGSTTIDLEDRYLTWKHAGCGVSKQYIVDKENKECWRDNIKPIGLLKKICVLRGWPQPTFKGKGSSLRCYVNGNEFKMKYFESAKTKKTPDDKQLGSDEHRLALYVLHELGVVPEHFETRTLYNDDCPGIPQGKLHLWVDIFPWDRNPPPPINVLPRETEKMVLRVIVWNTIDVILSDENFMGERMSDIFLKIHLEGMKNKKQETDIHFRSLTGEGNFNWRMCYEFDYLLAEQMLCTYQRKSIFQITKEMIKEPPLLHIEVYDYDIFSSNDLLGWTEFSFVAMPPPTKSAKECSLKQYLVPDAEKISIIDKKKIRGFWPVYDDSLGERELTGKVELEIEIMTEEEALEKPAGQGRSEPNEHPVLEAPDRPSTSFNWFLMPLIIFKILVWDKYKWYIIAAFLVLLVICFCGLIIYTSPGAITNAIIG